MSGSSKPLLKLLVVMGATAGMLSLIPSCRDNNESIFVRQIQLPAAPLCLPTPDPTAAFIGRGVIDVALSSRYQIDALVGNQMVARGDFKQTRSEPNRVIFKGADVHLLDDKQKEIGFYSVIANGEVDPQTSGDATYGLASFDLIPPGFGVKLRASLLAAGGGSVQSFEARFKVYGTTLGGTDVTTGEYAFGVDACYGCSIIYPSDANEPSLPQPNCKKVQSGGVTAVVTTGSQLPACIAGQDGVTDCRMCQGNPVCTPCRVDADCTDFASSRCASGHCT